jgi:hypothetical protein
MWVVHQRLAELWLLQKQRELTKKEQEEVVHCMDANMHKAWKLSKLKNMSLMASMTNDTEWQHELCMRIEKESTSMV